MSRKEETSIAYVAIINDKDEPILLKNYESTTAENLNFQMNILATLDLIDNKVYKKMLHSEYKGPVTSFLGCINSIYLSDDEFDIYGYITPGKNKILVILHQKSLSNYDDRHVQAFLIKLNAAYTKDIINPFVNSVEDHVLTSKFHSQIDSLVSEYQTILKKSI